MTPVSTFLDGQVPTQLRGLAWLSLSERGTILNRGGTADDLGGGKTTTYTSSGTVDCRVDPMGGSEGEVAHQIEDRSTHLITLPPETAIGHEDRFATEGETFEITAVRTRTREWMRLAEAVKLA